MLKQGRSLLRSRRLFSTAPAAPFVDFDTGATKGPWHVQLQPAQRLHPAKLLWSSRKIHQADPSLYRLPDMALQSPKRMIDSYVSVRLPFRTDTTLRENYVNYMGSVRLGKLLEDMDALAGTIAYRHVDDFDPHTRPPTCVTASVDQIVLLSALRADRDMKMCGHITHVGSSSMDIHLMIQREVLPGDDDAAVVASCAAPSSTSTSTQWAPMIMADFVMASRDPVSGKAFPVQRLECHSDQEKAIHARSIRTWPLASHIVSGLMAYAIGINQLRKEQRSRSLSFASPTAIESRIIHDIHLELKNIQKAGAANRPSHILFSSETKASSLRICFPQERNIHNKLFGGHLMREAFELAYALAAVYSRAIPRFLSQEDIQFHKAVEIGSIVSYEAQIVLALGHPHRSFQVAVTVDVISPRKGGARETTTVFSFTFVAPNDAPPLRRVLPETYEESIRVVEALRRKEDGQTFVKSLKEDPVPWVITEGVQ